MSVDEHSFPPIRDADILAHRPAKHAVDPRRPYAFLVEPEHTASGRVEDVATLFLTNRECPFRCLMCDLWKHTTDHSVPLGAIPEQIDYALARLPPTRHVKLYNSGNFFDAQAIPRSDHGAIAARVGRFETVIVENHPRLCSPVCLEFRDRLSARLEIALGLETAHPASLARLNKQMTLADFARAVEFLRSADIAVRAFILLGLPWLSAAEGVDWALRSIEHAFALGVGCCSVIPTRTGNGLLDYLARQADFAEPTLAALEQVHAAGLQSARGRGRVFIDLWDAERFAACPRCGPARRARLQQMNLSQRLLPPVACDCGDRSHAP